MTALKPPLSRLQPTSYPLTNPHIRYTHFNFDRYASEDAETPAGLTLKHQRVEVEVDGMATAATTQTTPTGSMLAAVRRWQASDYQQAAATQGHRLPVGWDPTAERGTAGYDLVLATPKTLSALAWFLVQQRPEVTEAINRAHAQATDAVAVELAMAVGAHPPTVVDHCYDSERQPWLHSHLLYGALQATDDGFKPLSGSLVSEQAGLHIWGYHLLLRRAVTDLVRELDLGWALAAEDGACEVLGLPSRVLATVEGPCRPLGEIAACRLE
jgi:hypothetical protein